MKKTQRVNTRNRAQMKASKTDSTKPMESGSPDPKSETADPPSKVIHTSAPNVEAASKSKTSESLVVVGIGASAGGLEAFMELLKPLPKKTGMAFVLIPHLDPKH
jgi:chemotaxis response regulator CheB